MIPRNVRHAAAMAAVCAAGLFSSSVASAQTAPAASAMPPPVTRSYRQERILLTTLGGVGGGFMGLGAGFYTGTLLGGGILGANRDPGAVLWGTALGSVVGTTAGVTLGVYLVGESNRGNGGLGWTLLGTLAGEAAVAGLWSGVAHDAVPVWVAGVGTVLLPAIGAVLGYELSSDDDARATRQRASARVFPTASATRDGAVAGLAGTF